MVVGEGKNFASAIIYPDYNYLESWCNVKDLKYEGPDEAIREDLIIKRIQREIDEMNKKLDRTEQIKKFVLLNEEWTIANNLLSQTLKLKRKALTEKYSDLIEDIYQEA